MKTMNLPKMSTVKPPKSSCCKTDDGECCNILAQNFNQPAPNLVWVCDFTYTSDPAKAEGNMPVTL